MTEMKNNKIISLFLSAVAICGCSGNKPEYIQEIDCAMNQMWDSMRMHEASHKAQELRDRILAMTDMEQRLEAARHFSRIVADEDMKNGRYILREYKGDEYPRIARYAFETLEESGGENMELCEFIFDALLHWKEACFAAITETCSDDGWDYGEKGRRHCARFLPMCYTNDMKVIERNVLVPLSLKLTRTELERFKQRYRDVAGKDWIERDPDGTRRRSSNVMEPLL